MKRRARIQYNHSQKALMWDRWRKGETLRKLKLKNSIRWKLSVAFLAMAGLVTALVGLSIASHQSTIERAAQLEAENIGRLIGDATRTTGATSMRLQRYVGHLHEESGRDITIVDGDKRTIADSAGLKPGATYSRDSGNEVAMTLRDGRIRTFLDKDARHPGGAMQVSIPIDHHGSGGEFAGAVIIDYTPTRETLLATDRANHFPVIMVGSIVVLLVTVLGLRITNRISQPLRELELGVQRIASADYDARVSIQSEDEFGRLALAFNKMAEDLSSGRAALLESKRELESRIEERTKDLADSNARLEDEVRQHRIASDRAEYLAYYDVLTGLANRGLFLERTAQYIRGASPHRANLALVLIDLERFRNINDSLGRLFGDDLLRHVAKRLTDSFGDANLVARVGADHFAVVLPEVLHEEDVVRRLQDCMGDLAASPFRHDGCDYSITAKFGVALYPDDGATAEILYRNAEAALKRAKGEGERVLFYTSKMIEADAGKKLTLENRLRRALERDEFVLHYQPKMNLRTGRLVGAEALIRWNDPGDGLVPPNEFIPVLEETGLILEVGRWAMNAAVEQFLRWRASGLPVVRIAVNVSALQLRDRNFVGHVRRALDLGLQASEGLELEITESMLMTDVARSIASLAEIRSMGVSVAIDDFGTGYSSLGYLSRLPVDTLKIDRSFVTQMNNTAEGLALVTSIVGLAHSLELKVVAEGVETEEQSRVLGVMRCDEMQGYLISKALPGNEFEQKFLRLDS